MNSTLIVRNAELVWDGATVHRDHEVVIVDGQVARVAGSAGPETPEGAVVLDATGCVVTPGLINAHHHLLQSAFRTLPGTRRVPMSEWLGVMAAAYRDRRVDPELAGHAAAVGLAESLLCGVTTVADHHLTWPEGIDPVELAAATVSAARSLGSRLVFVRGTAGDDADTAAASVEAMVARLRPDGSFLQLAVGPAGVHSDGPETFAALAEVAATHGLRRRTQANEQVDVVRALERYGRRPLALLDEWGWLGPDVTLAHLCEIDDHEIELLATTATTATHAPGCDVPMGWGIAPVGRLLDRGVAIGLGTSGGGSNDAGHVLADARLALQVSGLTDRALAAEEVLTMATAGAARGLGRPELGHLGPGAAGDVCCWAIDDVHDSGVDDALAGLLWAGPGRRPRHVVVGGNVVVADGVLCTADSRDLAAGLRTELAARDR